MPTPYVPLPIRLQAKSAWCPDPGCKCLLWTGALDRDGYGFLSVNDEKRRAHQAAWEAEKGPVPDGKQLDHVKARGCQHRHCILVAHLEPVTISENVLRGNGITAVNARKTDCAHGHPFDEANTYRYANGKRRCRACGTAHDRARRAPGITHCPPGQCTCGGATECPGCGNTTFRLHRGTARCAACGEPAPAVTP